MIQGVVNFLYVVISLELKGVLGKYFFDWKEIQLSLYVSDDVFGEKVIQYCE